MKKKVKALLIMASLAVCLNGQTPKGFSYEIASSAPAIQWVCPEVEKYQGILLSSSNDDYKIYANTIMEQFEPYTNPSDPTDKYLITQGLFTIENPYYDVDNLFNHITSWLKSNKKYNCFAKLLSVDKEKNMIITSGTVHVASHSSLLEIYNVFITPLLIIQFNEENKLLISLSINSYNNEIYGGDKKHVGTKKVKVSEVYPFDPKSSYKISYAKAYVSSYKYFWNFISDLRNELNAHFSRDSKMLAKMHYKYANDSLKNLYGEPTKVIVDELINPDINKEIHVYEEAKKIIFMGKTVNFKDILSCDLKDDPQIIPGSSTTLGAGISLFGIGLGGGNTYRTPDKTIHNYVVNIKIDSLKNPLILIATGQNEFKAKEIVSVIEYILRHR